MLKRANTLLTDNGVKPGDAYYEGSIERHCSEGNFSDFKRKPTFSQGGFSLGVCQRLLSFVNAFSKIIVIITCLSKKCKNFLLIVWCHNRIIKMHMPLSVVTAKAYMYHFMVFRK